MTISSPVGNVRTWVFSTSDTTLDGVSLGLGAFTAWTMPRHVKWRDSSSGSLDNITVTNNNGPGIDIDTTGTVTVGSYTSSGNGAADDLA